MDLLLLAGGRGTRMRPLTKAVPKPMLPHASSTIIEEIIRKTKPYFDNIIISANYKIDYFKENLRGVTIHSDEYGSGTGYGVLTAENVLSDDFVVMNADISFEESTVEDLISQEPPAIVGYTGDNSERYGSLVVDDNNNLVSLPEKDNTSGKFVNAGIYYLDSSVFNALKKIEKSERGEYEITDALELLAKKSTVRVIGTENWSSFEYPWELLSKRETTYISPKANVHEDAIIRGPSYIGDGVTVGPKAEIKNSILMNGTNVKHTAYIGDSILAPNVNIGAGTVVANIRHDEGKVFCKGKNTRLRKFGAILAPGVKTGINTSINPGSVITENTMPGEVI